MYSLSFPKMFKANKAVLEKDHDAVLNQLKLLLATEKYTLYGDPFYGTQLKHVIFEQNNGVVRDLVIDEIYSAIQNFMPQVYVRRKDIEVISDGVDLYANIRCTFYADQKTDMYSINLTDVEQE